jgi:hypothetical protein
LGGSTEIARNLAAGRGLTDWVTRPVGLALAGQQADGLTFSAPLYPAILSLPIRLLGPSDRVVGLSSLLFATLTLVLIHYLCATFLSRQVAVGSVALLALTLPFMMHAVSGTEVPCLALLVTGLFGLMMAWRRAGNHRSLWWPIAASAIVALCWLIRYETGVLLVCVALFWWLAYRPRLWRQLLWTLLPFALIAGPWGVRNSLLLHRPMVSEYSYRLLESVSLYPEDAAMRSCRDVPERPWGVALAHPGMMLRKLWPNLMQMYASVTQFANPYVMAWFLVGVVLATVRRRQRTLHWCLLAGILLTGAATCLYVPAAGLLVIFAPMVVALAVNDLADTLRRPGPEAPAAQVEGEPPRRGRWARFRLLRGPHPATIVSAGLVIFGIWVAVPMLDYLFAHPPARTTPLAEGAGALRAEPYALIMSDAPEAVAWYADKRALMLPRDRYDLAAIEQAGVRADAIYLSPSPKAERAIFPGFERVSGWEHPGARLRRLPEQGEPPPQGGE